MRYLPALAAALALIVCADPAGAFKRSTVPSSNACLYWPDRTITWHAASPFGLEPEAPALTAIRASFETWSANSCTDLAFMEGARVPHAVGFDAKGPNENVVLFRAGPLCETFANDPCAAAGTCVQTQDCWDYDQELFAVTTTTFEKCGQLLDADIELNGGQWDFTAVDGPLCSGPPSGDCVSTDVQNTATHEIGHFIGLAHPDTTFDGSSVREDTMYKGAAIGETKKRSLAPDDIEGLCTIYPAGKPANACVSAECPSPKAKGGCQCSSGSAASLGALALLRRRRQADGAASRRASSCSTRAAPPVA